MDEKGKGLEQSQGRIDLGDERNRVTKGLCIIAPMWLKWQNWSLTG